jgi:uncharacterized protein (DUF697 family)
MLELRQHQETCTKKLQDNKKTTIVCFNKTDCCTNDVLRTAEQAAQRFFNLVPFDTRRSSIEFNPTEHFLFTSGIKNRGIKELVEIIWKELPNSVRKFHANKKTEEEIEMIITKQQESFARHQKIQPKIKHALAQSTIVSCCIFSGLVAALNIPISDALVITPAQVGMVIAILKIYNKPITWKSVSQVIGTCVSGIILRSIAQNALSLFNIAIEVGTLGVATPVVIATTGIKISIAVSGTLAIGEATVLFCGEKFELDEESKKRIQRTKDFEHKHEALKEKLSRKLSELQKMLETIKFLN